MEINRYKMGLATDEQNFGKMKSCISKSLNFDCKDYTDSFITRRVEVRLRANRLEKYEDYCKLLENNLEEQKKLEKELTIHTTNFYRDASLYDYLKNDLFKTIASKKAFNKTINVWSAGSSTGEEALTIAICFYEALGQDLNGYKIKIIGTDRDLATVQKAREAKYNIAQFRELPSDLLNKYFIKNEEDYEAKNNIKSLTEFRVGNILDSNKPRGMDIIFCRNTVIYFDSETKSKLYDEIYNLLSNGSYFILGKTEILIGPAREKFKLFNMNERIYIKE